MIRLIALATLVMLTLTGSSVAAADLNPVEAPSRIGLGSEGWLGDPISETPVTVVNEIRLGAGFSGDFSNSELWLAGLFNADKAAPRGIVLRWVKTTDSWFPTWELEIASDSGLIDSGVISLGNFAPKDGHTYQAALAYDPVNGDLSISLDDLNGDGLELAAHLRVSPTSGALYPGASVPIAGTGEADAGDLPSNGGVQFARVDVVPAYTRMGVPLAMVSAFRAVVGGGGSGDFRSGRTRFLVGDPVAVRFEWPSERVPGEVEVDLLKGDARTTIARASWAPDEQTFAVDAVSADPGSPTVVITYVDGDYEFEIERQSISIVANILEVLFVTGGRDSEFKLAGTVHLKPARPGFAGTLRIKAEFFPSTSSDGTPVDLGTLNVPIDDESRYRVPFQLAFDVPFRFDLPPDAGRVRLTASFSDPTVSLIGRETMMVQVKAAPAMEFAFAGEAITSEIGRPAFLLVGAQYPSVTVRPARDGVLSAQLVRTKGHAAPEDGVVVDQVSGISVKAGQASLLTFAERASEPGVYRIDMTLRSADQNPAYASLYFSVAPTEPLRPDQSEIAYVGEDGKMVYVPDFLGNRIPDFSHSGYMGGGVSIPDVPVVVTVQPGEGDDTARIQSAINEVASRPPDERGIRGAVLLKEGTYEVSGQLDISTGGVVLRGEGDGETLIRATGTSARPLISVDGGAVTAIPGTARPITDLYVPVGARRFHVANADDLKVGQTIIVRRHSNQAWIHAIGMDRIPARSNTVQWTPFDLDFDRVITQIDGNLITVDAPIVNAIEARWGGGEVIISQDSRIEQVGVENLRTVSDFDPSITCELDGMTYPCDEDHATYAVQFGNVKNAWVRDVTTMYFAHGPVIMRRESKWITAQDLNGTKPISILTGSRRYPYQVLGSLILVQRAYSDGARHAFAVSGRAVTGPNVFLYSEADRNFARSEPHQRWSVGGLFDNVIAPIAIQDRGNYGSGHGWAGANYVAWNTTGTLVAQQPPTAQTWAIGHVGEKLEGDFAPKPDAYWESLGRHVQPASLYLQQLKDRLGPQAVINIGYEHGLTSQKRSEGT